MNQYIVIASLDRFDNNVSFSLTTWIIKERGLVKQIYVFVFAIHYLLA